MTQKKRTDQYMRITARCFGTSRDSVVSRVCSKRGWSCYMFPALLDTQKWCRRPSVRREVSFVQFSFAITNCLYLRYCNMDYFIFACLVGITLLRIILTYDIVCQWSKNFRKCMADFPPEMRIPDSTQVDVAIPGWHINAHGEKCRENFNLSYMEGAGRTVGEDIETTWAGTNALGPSVREMGPAACHDTLNDH
jgi:hypothetical protein